MIAREEFERYYIILTKEGREMKRERKPDPPIETVCRFCGIPIDYADVENYIYLPRDVDLPGYDEVLKDSMQYWYTTRAGYSSVACLACARLHGYWCYKHDLPHGLFGDGKNRERTHHCHHCIREIATEQREEAVAVWARLQAEMPKEQVTYLREDVRENTAGPMDEELMAIRVFTYILKTAVGGRTSPETILEQVVRAKNVHDIIPPRIAWFDGGGDGIMPFGGMVRASPEGAIPP
jgi:hypothetical protein